MQAKEDFSIRLEMAEMHEEFIDRMTRAYDNKNYVETVWICYAIFEQRISRLIAKYIDKCPVPKRKDKKTCAISTRVKCIQKLIDSKYGAFEDFDKQIMSNVKEWCNKRNVLVHGLISLQHYKEYDKEFKQLAEQGVPLVFELYDVCTDFRNKWYEEKELDTEFPMKNCLCKKQQCINPKCI